jgi:hypothetical protein
MRRRCKVHTNAGGSKSGEEGEKLEIRNSKFETRVKRF